MAAVTGFKSYLKSEVNQTFDQTFDRSGEVISTIRVDGTKITAGSQTILRISTDPNATSTPGISRKTPKRIGDILLFEDGSWIPIRKLSGKQRKEFGL